jgi:hypothetical protein
MYSQAWSPTPSTTAAAPLLRTAKRSAAMPRKKASPCARSRSQLWLHVHQWSTAGPAHGSMQERMPAMECKDAGYGCCRHAYRHAGPHIGLHTSISSSPEHN